MNHFSHTNYQQHQHPIKASGDNKHNTTINTAQQTQQKQRNKQRNKQTKKQRKNEINKQTHGQHN